MKFNFRFNPKWEKDGIHCNYECPGLTSDGVFERCILMKQDEREGLDSDDVGLVRCTECLEGKEGGIKAGNKDRRLGGRGRNMIGLNYPTKKKLSKLSTKARNIVYDFTNGYVDLDKMNTCTSTDLIKIHLCGVKTHDEIIRVLELSHLKTRSEYVKGRTKRRKV